MESPGAIVSGNTIEGVTDPAAVAIWIVASNRVSCQGNVLEITSARSAIQLNGSIPLSVGGQIGPNQISGTFAVQRIEDFTGGLNSIDVGHSQIDHEPTGLSEVLNLEDSACHKIDLESAPGNVSVSLAYPHPGIRYTILVEQDSAAPKNLTWSGLVTWPGGVAPVISPGGDAQDVIELDYDVDTNRFRARCWQAFA
jgi:hypothetical protein